MTREEKIKEVLNKHFGHEVKEGSDEWYTLNYQNRFRDLDEMADWCDSHPRKGLWDANKVLAWISQNIESYCKLNTKNFNNLLFDLGKAMED